MIVTWLAGLIPVCLVAHFVSARLLEAVLIGAVLVPVLFAAPVRPAFRGLRRPLRALLAGMIALTVLGQLILDENAFPFVAWRMYASGTRVVRGTVPADEFAFVLRAGQRVPLVPEQFFGPQSADRMTSLLLGQAEKPATRPQEAAMLAAIARLYNRDHPTDPATGVVVLERRVAVSSGRQTPPRILWRVELA